MKGDLDYANPAFGFDVEAAVVDDDRDDIQDYGEDFVVVAKEAYFEVALELLLLPDFEMDWELDVFLAWAPLLPMP